MIGRAKEKAIKYFMDKEKDLCCKSYKPKYPLQLDKTIDIAIQERDIEWFNKIRIVKENTNTDIKDLEEYFKT